MLETPYKSLAELHIKYILLYSKSHWYHFGMSIIYKVCKVISLQMNVVNEVLN